MQTLIPWASNAELFPNLMFKTETGRYATFCGYYVGSMGAVRCPKPLLTKLMLAGDDGSLYDKIASYVAEFSVDHSLGDDMWEVLPVEQVSYQSACFDFICRHAPREVKVVLQLGEAPENLIPHWAASLTRPIFAILNRSQRLQYLRYRSARFATWASSFLPF